jgi:regulation of enolase protein 1 (concanavalin A-like superfamily)
MFVSEVVLPAIPGPLRSSGDGAWHEVDGGVVGSAGPATDLFVDPATGATTLNAPRLLLPMVAGDFQLAARVEVAFAATFDAGVLLLWAGDNHWAKLCFEPSPQREPMVVSVVTRGVSDDANGFTVTGSAVWLRVSRINGAFAYHASTDGTQWTFVRQFALGDGPPEVGLEVQSPTGNGVTATFTRVSFTQRSLTDLRDGT